jgi:hypothetical protein
LEQVARVTVVVSTEAGDRAEFAGVDAAAVVEDTVLHMDHHNLADHQIRGEGVFANGNDLPQRAFEIDR